MLSVYGTTLNKNSNESQSWLIMGKKKVERVKKKREDQT